MTHGDGARPLTLVVVGASGDLAMKKVLPAIFALHCQGYLPERVTIMGFARTPMSDAAFREQLSGHLTCRYAPGADCAHQMERFLARCFYCAGNYAERGDFVELYARMKAEEGEVHADRLFYMAIPPFLFLDVAHAIAGAGLVQCGGPGGWSRVVIEKPFGRDRTSSDELTAHMAQVFTEAQTFRIDHYLGKEVIQNLLVLRFANAVFEPLWDRAHIEHVRIAWQEDIGVGARGGYFDRYGIIRDVMQNHLLQILALTAMEPPSSLGAQHVRDAKVEALRSVAPVAREDLVLGQYQAARFKGQDQPSYTDDPSVPDGSRTPTYAAAVLRIQNARWNGAPFFITAGKGLAERMTEVRVRFRSAAGGLFAQDGALRPNELVIRVQPDEAISLHIVNKRPGLALELAGSALDLRYAAQFETVIPDAYECLLLDVIRGEKSLFIRADELEAAWDVFTPVLEAIEEEAVAPEPYAFGSAGPASAAALAARCGVTP